MVIRLRAAEGHLSYGITMTHCY